MAAQALLAPSPRAYDAMFGLLAPGLPAAFRQRNPSDKVRKLGALLPNGSTGSAYLSVLSRCEPPWSSTPRKRDRRDRSRSVPAAARVTGRMMFLDAVTSLPEDMFAKVDLGGPRPAAGPAASPSSHVAWPSSSRIRDDRGKWIRRQVLDRYVPRRMVERPKMGFDPPIGTRMRGPLRGWAEDLLDAG